jgi:glycosyltransferase involved in cell wall biosynthesis
MKILYFPFEFPPFFVGGLGTYAFEMSRRFAKMGHSVTVFAKNPGDAITRDLYEGVEVHRPLLAEAIDLLPLIVPEDVKRWPLPSQNYFAEVFMYNVLSATKSTNLLVKTDKRDFDLIVSHDWLGSIAGIMSKRMLQKPMVFHLHSVEEGRMWDGSATIKNLERRGASLAETVVTVSYAMRDQLVSLGYEEWKIRVVYNGVDEQKYDPKKVSQDQVQELRRSLGVGEDPMIFYIGRLAWVKGADTLIRAMPFVLREIPSAKLIILGKGEQEGMIKNLIVQLGLQKNVVLKLEYVDEKERIRYYAAADVAAFPSKYEPFGIVCTEAMSMETPVVIGARGISGLREQVVSDGPERCGAHVNPNDPYDIAKFLIEILSDDGLRKTLGKNARRRVLERFTLDQVAENTIRIYKDVANIQEAE